MTKQLARITVAILCAGVTLTAPAAPRVLVTLKPVHSLVTALMQGIATPQLLITGGASPHAYSMRPSDARALAAAELVIWVGPTMETFLTKPLAQLGPTVHIVPLINTPGIKKLPARAGGAWQSGQHEPADRNRHAIGQAGDHNDPHLWLNPENAAAIATTVTQALVELDPVHAARYQANNAILRRRLRSLDTELRATLAPVRNIPFLVFHDAYQYFERRYGMAAVGAVTIRPDRPVGARRLTEIRALALQSGARCIFAEPQFTPRLLTTIAEGTRLRSDVLDPLGADLPPGPDAYFILLRNLARHLESCLSGNADP